MTDKQIPLDIDRLALMIGRQAIENLGLAQQLEAAQAKLALLQAQQPSPINKQER